MTDKVFNDVVWAAEPGEVVMHQRKEEVWHVTKRLIDWDKNVKHYELWDATHTRCDYVYEEDFKDLFKTTDVVVKCGRKPIVRLDGRLLDGEL